MNSFEIWAIIFFSIFVIIGAIMVYSFFIKEEDDIIESIKESLRDKLKRDSEIIRRMGNK